MDKTKKNQKNMHKKPLFFVIFTLFLFTLCSGCSKSVENCKFQPKIDVKINEKDESGEKKGKIIETESTSAQVSCNF